MSRRGVYLYGFARPGPLSGLDVEGVDGPAPVEAVDLRGVAAVISEVDLDAFEAGTAGEADPAWIVPRALRHERVVEAVLARSAVLPVRFGAVFSTRAALEAHLAGRRDAIDAFLDRVDGREEWSIKAYLDPERGVEVVLATDPELSERFRALPAAPGARYLREKGLRDDARRRARTLARSQAASLAEAVGSTVVDARALPVRAPEPSGREMLLHLACLLPRGAAGEVAGRAREAAASAGGLLEVEPSGPWPPYHFCPPLDAEVPST